LCSEAKINFELVGDGLARRFRDGPTSIRATFAGHMGDPGIPTSLYYLYYDRENRERLCQSVEHYRAVFGSRQVMAATSGPAIGDASISPGMAMALDHRTLLPPFFPVLHAEDFSFGALLWKVCPDALFGHLPLAVGHHPPPGKEILTPHELADAPFVIFEFAHLLRRLLFRHPTADGQPAEQRMRAIGRWLRELGDAPPSDFQEMLRGEALEEASNRIDYLSLQMDEFGGAPPYWQEDVQRLMAHYHHAVTLPDFEIPWDLQSHGPAEENRRFLQQLLLRYGGLLMEWPSMVAAAKALRDAGAPLFQSA
jgi:hypothetical protein